MAVGKEEPMNPVHLFAHGSTMMLGEEHHSGDYWKKCGDEALAAGIEHVIVMVSVRVRRGRQHQEKHHPLFPSPPAHHPPLFPQHHTPIT